jgi:hypothetical protein
MTDSSISSNVRSFSKVDAKRAFINVAVMAIVGAGYWFVLPAIQLLIIPTAPNGDNGPWVVRPILAVHFCATVAMAAVTFPLLTWPLQQVWNRKDAALGTRYDPFHGRAAKRGFLLVKSFLLLAIYASGLVFYLFSWTMIGPDGIEQRLPWTTQKHSYKDILWLETIPDGERSESITGDGPWYSIKPKSGRSITLSEDNEGSTLEELLAMTSYIADGSGLRWMRRTDARAH